MAFPQLGYPQYLSGSPVPAESASPREGAAELGSSAALLGLYANPYTAQSYGAFLPYSSAELALFSHMGSQYELKDSPGIHHPSFASHAAFYPYGQYQYGDPARAKSATRETTSTLKAWLQEHKKNPYPTKGEKIMLAIITKMTLTQVSTWFANARRRLKKENKVTWGRSAEDRDGKIFDSDNEGEKNEDEEIDLESIDIDNIDDNNEDHDDVSDKQEADGETVARNGDKTQQPLTVPTHRAFEKTKQESAVSSPSNQVTYQQPDSKPKIWSLAETATSPDHSRRHAVSPPQHPAFLPSHGIYTCQVGKLHNWPNVAFLRDASLSGVKSLLGMDRTQQQYGHHAQTGLQQQPGMKSAPSAPAPNCETLTSRHTDREKVSRTTLSPTLSKTTPPHMHDSTRKQQETRHHAPVLAAST